MTAALFLLEDVDLALELGVGRDGAGNGHNLATLDLVALGAAEQQTTVLASPGLVHRLVEHLDAGNRGLLGLTDTEDLDLGVDGQLAALNTTGDDGATTGDREDVLDRHEEGLVHVTLGGGDVGIHRVHELLDLGNPLRVALEGLQSGDLDDRGVAIKVLGLEQVAALFLDQFHHFLVVNHVGLVKGDEDGGDADLTGEQNVLAGLGHGAVGGGDHEDRAVHLGRTGDHVLDVVGVAGGVNVRVVALLGLVLDVGDVDRDTTIALLGSVVDLIEGGVLVQIGVLIVQHLGDSCRQRRLAVVNVTNRADVDVRLGALKLGLRHLCPPGLG